MENFVHGYADLKAGMDERLASHYAHLFIRDPLVIFSESLNTYSVDNNDNFEVGEM